MNYKISMKVPDGMQIKKLYEQLDMESKNMSINEIFSSYIQNSLNLFIFDENQSLFGIIRGCGDSIWSMNIDLLVIRKDMQNQGYGTILLGKFLELCKSKYVTVCTQKKNFDFYKKFGFEKIEEGYYQLKR